MDLALETIKLFPKQCQQAWEETQKLDISSFQNVRNIYISGMGASAFNYYVLKALYSDILAIPLLLNNDYSLPQAVNSDSLLIASSFSGTTVEVIKNVQIALTKNVKITGISQLPSPLGNILEENNLKYYHLVPTYNPSLQPRMATGYMITGLLGLLSKAGMIVITPAEISDCINFIIDNDQNIENESKSLAEKIANKEILIMAGEHLSGNAHVLRNQFHESAKNFANYYLLPEMNHHLMEGLSFPTNFRSNCQVLALKSNLYSSNINLRYDLTSEVLTKNGLEIQELEVKGATKTMQVFYLLSFGSYLSYYLSKINKVDPIKIPWVDYFKAQLAAHDKK